MNHIRLVFTVFIFTHFYLNVSQSLTMGMLSFQTEVAGNTYSNLKTLWPVPGKLLSLP